MCKHGGSTGESHLQCMYASQSLHYNLYRMVLETKYQTQKDMLPFFVCKSLSPRTGKLQYLCLVCMFSKPPVYELYSEIAILDLFGGTVQAGGNTLCSEFHKFINYIWEEEMPHKWKESVIVLYKKGDKIYCSNYRGILLLPTTYRILSNILLSRLTPYLDEIIGDPQHGFLHNR